MRPVLSQPGPLLDATCGNGFDTVFLLRESSPSSIVYALDLQAAALEATELRVFESLGRDALGRLQLLPFDHADLPTRAIPVPSGLRASIVNLGYLPGGDKSIITRPESTVALLNAIFPILLPAGRLAVVVYPDHPGGREEANVVDQWFSRQGVPRPAKPIRGPYLWTLIKEVAE